MAKKDDKQANNQDNAFLDSFIKSISELLKDKESIQLKDLLEFALKF